MERLNWIRIHKVSRKMPCMVGSQSMVVLCVFSLPWSGPLEETTLDGVEKASPGRGLSKEAHGSQCHEHTSLWEHHQLLPLSAIHLLTSLPLLQMPFSLGLLPASRIGKVSPGSRRTGQPLAPLRHSLCHNPLTRQGHSPSPLIPRFHFLHQ